ncbi:MAG: glycosyltransferase family 2 protein, partial [Bacteroidia bacterium]
PFSKKINSGEDLLGTDSRLFYNAILAHRNSSNAAFCCGAGSIHRRKALESLVLNSRKRLSELNSNIFIDAEKVKNKKFAITASSNGVITGPFVHHISEDIYTSILLHSEKEKWKSYQHPDVECKMLSPQTLPDYVKQFSRYAEGTFDIFFSRDNPLIKKGLTPRQKLAYAETIYSYFSPLWILIFLLSPIIFYFFLIPPIKAFNFDFFIRFLSLHLFSQLMVTTAHWGMSTKRAEQYYIGGFWIKLKALYKVIIGKKLQFNTTIKERKINPLSYNLKFIYPHLVIIALTLIGLIYNGILIINETHPSYSAFFANTLWASYNIYLINPIVRAAFIK